MPTNYAELVPTEVVNWAVCAASVRATSSLDWRATLNRMAKPLGMRKMCAWTACGHQSETEASRLPMSQTLRLHE